MSKENHDRRTMLPNLAQQLQQASQNQAAELEAEGIKQAIENPEQQTQGVVDRIIAIPKSLVPDALRGHLSKPGSFSQIQQEYQQERHPEADSVINTLHGLDAVRTVVQNDTDLRKKG